MDRISVLAFGVDIEIWGFDSGKGLPAPKDYRDLPYIRQEAFFEFDNCRWPAEPSKLGLRARPAC
ncbi:MAG: hypothetical protein GWM88_14255 [Pseudomonadales bacterium]|nr:hypothetical protein [Pseudomonadales bacterium]NIX09103.1 hypothetical protein [Pseudomonadales bacterium]